MFLYRYFIFLSLRVDKIFEERKRKIGQRIRRLRVALNLTQKELAEQVHVSVGTIRAIETGEGFTGDYLLAIAHFFGMELSELVDYHAEVPDEADLREHMAAYHLHYQSDLDENLLHHPPNLKHLVNARLSQSSFMQEPRKVREIMRYIEAQYNLKYSSSALSQALINAVKAGVLQRVKTGLKNYGYQAVPGPAPAS